MSIKIPMNYFFCSSVGQEDI